MPRKTTKPRVAKATSGARQAAEYRHKEETPARPDVGTQPQFKKRAPPKTYRYDSSLAPALDWDGQNPAREQGEALIQEITSARTIEAAKAAAAKLKSLSKPFLNWAGKAERLSFDVPTLPLFVHERLSTRAILETLKGHRRDKQLDMFDLFADPQRPIHEQVLRAYEYQDKWVNRMILGDSLVVMNSLLHYESLGGQVQMIYMDPPYGVKFGSNFQPFVRKRDVAHGDDDDMTREPEMVQAYRDTWELGLHSYLTYLRDRLLLSRELLSPSGSIFVQISDENLHHAREVMDEVFGASNFVVVICYRRLGMMVGELIQSSAHYLLWYARDKERMTFRKQFERQVAGIGTGDHYTQLEHRATGETRSMTPEEKGNPNSYTGDWRPFQLISLTTGGYRPNTTIDYAFDGRTYHPGANKCWRTTKEGLDRLASQGRLVPAGNTLRYKQYLGDFPLTEITTIWDDTARDPENLYVVQTPSNVVRRCLLMATNPGDLVLDPTCGSGTTAYVAEQWGRRWITIDTSRVPLALARQRLLTATFPWYELRDEQSGPAAGFVYERKQNSRGEEVGGIVPHITLRSIATSEPPQEEVLVDCPEETKAVTRVTGPFALEATVPAALDPESVTHESPEKQDASDLVDRMLEVLRRSPVLRLEGNRSVTVTNLRRPAKTLSLSAEGMIANGKDRPIAFVFGPENGAVVEKLVWEAAREAKAKDYDHLYVIGFAIQPPARQLIESCEQVTGIAATYVQATPDLMMGDLLKNMRSSQIFSVCGLPEIQLRKNAIYSELRRIAGQNQSQLVLATHSEVIMDSVDVGELTMLLDRPRPLSSIADRQALVQALRVLTHTDILRAQTAIGILYVEGRTDLDILREWARILNHPVLRLLDGEIFWKPVSYPLRDGGSGVTSGDHYRAIRLVRDIPALEIVDRDAGRGRDPTAITGTGFQRVRWGRYETESYLFHPAPLARFIAKEVGEAGAREALASLNAHLRDTQPPRFMENPLEDLPFLTGSKAREVLIPPALQAAGVYGVPYTRYHEIASLMRPEEIHPEVKEKLDAIQKAFNL